MKGCRPLTDSEVDLVSATFGGRYVLRDRALFLLGVRTGYRVSELLSLRIGDVLQHGRLVDRVSVRRRHTKGKTEGRTVVLHHQAREALVAWLEQLEVEGAVAQDTFLFRSRKGGNRPISRQQAWTVLREAFDANELPGPLGTHSLRKTFAARVHEALGGDVFKTQQALGHRSPSSTVAYLSFKQEEIDEAILLAP